MTGRAGTIRSVAVLAVALTTLHVRGASGAVVGFHFGLDFIETPIEAPRSFWPPDWPPGTNPGPFDFEPYPITNGSSPTHFVADGGLAGWIERQVRREIAVRVDDAYRAIDTGDPDTTVGVAIYVGRVPQDVRGTRANVALGQISDPFWSFYGQGHSLYAIANDDYAAAIYLDEIDNGVYLESDNRNTVYLDEMGNPVRVLTYDTADVALNAIVGTVAHEIGHTLGVGHVAAGNAEPYPLMAIEFTGLPTEARTTVRRFSAANAARILREAGTFNRADFNGDHFVDGADISTLVDNFGQGKALFQEADSNGDHYVDVADLSALVAGWTGDPGPARQGTAAAEYDPATGEFTVSVDNVMSWTLRSDGRFTGADMDRVLDILPLGDDFNLPSANLNTVGEGGFGAGMTYADIDLGSLTEPGTDASRFTIEYVTGYGQPRMRGTITVIPEPGTVVMLLSGLLGLLLAWRRWRAA